MIILSDRAKRIIEFLAKIVVGLIFVFILISAGVMFEVTKKQDKMEKQIVKALNNCEQLIADKWVISPTVDCARTKAGIIGLKVSTFSYGRNK